MARRMFVYQVYVGGEDSFEFFPTLRLATAAARDAIEQSNGEQDESEIQLCEVTPLTKEAVCRILTTNGGGWCVSRQHIKTVTAKRRSRRVNPE